MRRPYLQNEQIKIAARKIAHDHTANCGRVDGDHWQEAAWHSPSCNTLRDAIVELCMQVKCAGLQPSKVEKDRATA